MFSEQKHNISFIPFFFFIAYKNCLVKGRLYMPLTTYKISTKSAALRKLNSGYLNRFLKNSPIALKMFPKKVPMDAMIPEELPPFLKEL